MDGTVAARPEYMGGTHVAVVYYIRGCLPGIRDAIVRGGSQEGLLPRPGLSRMGDFIIITCDLGGMNWIYWEYDGISSPCEWGMGNTGRPG